MKSLIGLALTLFLSGTAFPDDDAASDHRLEQFKLGNVVSGAVALDKLQGKVVALEFWGYQ